MKKSVALLPLAVLFAFATPGSPALVAATSSRAGGIVKVTLTYTGKGAVDDSHRIWVWLFTSPDIGSGSMPIAEMSVGLYVGSDGMPRAVALADAAEAALTFDDSQRMP